MYSFNYSVNIIVLQTVIALFRGRHCPMRGYMNLHYEEPICPPPQTLEGSSPIGYYATLFDVVTCTSS